MEAAGIAMGYGKQRANILPWKIEEKTAISVLMAPVYSSTYYFCMAA
jgi:hypothetical protein